MLVKMPPASMNKLVAALSAAGIKVDKLGDRHAIFEFGFIGILKSQERPMVGLDFRTTDDQSRSLLDAFYGIGGWGIMNERFYLKPTPEGVLIHTLDKAAVEGLL